MNKLISVAVLSAAGGYALGYIVCKSFLKKTYEEILAEEIATTKNHFDERNKAAQREFEKTLIERDTENLSLLVAAQKSWTHYTGVDTDAEINDPGPELEDLIAERRPKVNYRDLEPRHSATQVTVEELAIAQRSAPVANEEPVVDMTKPHLITQEDFFSGDSGYIEATYTYYAGDNTLTGEGDEIMDLQTRINAVGNCLDLFGDETTIYVRNPYLELDIEINRSDGKYSVEVAGLGG